MRAGQLRLRAPTVPCPAPPVRLPARCNALQVISEFLQSLLAGEGDVLRTLGRLGYRVSYSQDPRRELNFAGVRGARGRRPVGPQLQHPA